MKPGVGAVVIAGEQGLDIEETELEVAKEVICWRVQREGEGFQDYVGLRADDSYFSVAPVPGLGW